MSTHRSRRIDRATAERLLAGARSDTANGHEALAGLLAAAAAPAVDSELSGEQEAMAMFRAARLDPVPVPATVPVRVPTSRRRSMLTPAMLLGAKVAATALAATLGGVAVAAGTGHLPVVLGGTPERTRPAPSATAGTGTGTQDSGEVPPGALLRAPEAVPADLAELCRAFAHAHAARAGGSDPDDVLSEHRFAALVTAAGSRSEVPGYCAPVLNGRPEQGDASPTPVPTDSARGASPTRPGKHEPSRGPVSPGPRLGEHGPDTHPTGPPSTGTSPPRRDVPTGRPTGTAP
ncbi:hypothetical protein J7F03_21710 [Streptomyces sp. ISL-43]|uniref:hypothetical protein n=1 Tax=Streptomyces sp. ISL-43 TaxID=2819183 RepID=UPI001BE98156|nr:hypothetical protein [Streptomyces sp. ISL-43]MBT2449650.1 hypothetical protein [Streptomyces sp. ISL-43]